MQISKNSWHYQFINRYAFQPAQDICRYFWQVPLIIAMLVVVGLVLGVVALFLLSPWISLILYWFGDHPLVFIMSEAAPASIVLQFIVALVFGGGWLIDRFRRYLHCLPVIDKPPGPVKMYYRAWKDKYCPTIKFTGDE